MTMVEMAEKLFGKVEAALEAFTLKCHAEGRRLVVDLKVLEDPEIARLSKETMLLKLRQERANLQRQAAIAARPQPGKQGWRDGKSKPHQAKPMPKDKQPLTHRMSIPAAQPEQQVEAAPQEAAPEVSAS